MEASSKRIHTPEGSPQVRVLDARLDGLDERGLRERARSFSKATRARYVTRSYRYPYALVAWHNEPVGVDIERIEPCDAAFAELICTPDERPEAAASTDFHAHLTSLWCSKEALAKALGSPLRYAPDKLESPSRWADLRCGSWHATPLETVLGHTAWLCWRTVGTKKLCVAKISSAYSSPIAVR